MMRSVRPSGSSPGQKLSTKASFTTTTFSSSASSVAVSARPRDRGSPNVSKYPGVTRRMFTDGTEPSPRSTPSG
jgi:hypothetical protein